ncbi:MAG: protein involved in polysaccharide export with SLBB domain [Glaciecola sp.]|jgi:protein involved in polysaccharide export with SLBB domain
MTFKLSSFVRYLAILVLGLFAVCSNLQAQSNADLSQYTLGSGDVVQITVFGQEDLSVQTRLSNVGAINYPFLGEVNLVGLSVNQVENMIDTGLRGDYLVNPSVSVTVLEYRPFFIDGAVNRPGGYPYQPGLSVNKAAALAGGYTERASRDKIIIVRNVSGVETTIEALVSDTILPGDIVTVQERFF